MQWNGPNSDETEERVIPASQLSFLKRLYLVAWLQEKFLLQTTSDCSK